MKPVYRGKHKISLAYEKLYPRNCPVMEYTPDEVYVGVCTFYVRDGVCQRHGLVKRDGSQTAEKAV